MPTITFVSQRREVYQNGMLIANENTNPRGIILKYSPLGNEVDITIVGVKYNKEEGSFEEIQGCGVLRTKHARIVSDSGTVLKYVCTQDPDFEFEILTKPDNTIRCFTLIRLDTGKVYKYFDQ